MRYGTITPKQTALLHKYTEGKEVYDLGAGNLDLAYRIALGAKRVIAIDPESPPVSDDPKVDVMRLPMESCLDYVPSKLDVVVVSWPVNTTAAAFNEYIARATTVIYRGKNTSGVGCGRPRLFKALLQRELLGYEPHHKNAVVVVGSRRPELRAPEGEELAGLCGCCAHWSYEDVERAAREMKALWSPLLGKKFERLADLELFATYSLRRLGGRFLSSVPDVVAFVDELYAETTSGGRGLVEEMLGLGQGELFDPSLKSRASGCR